MSRKTEFLATSFPLQNVNFSSKKEEEMHLEKLTLSLRRVSFKNEKMKCPSCQSENLPDSRFCHKCATPLVKETEISPSFTKTLQTPFEELTRGTLFAGRYEVIEILGRGGMGKVYRVFDQKIKEIVALKVIKPEIGFNEKAIDRLKNELKFARKISHRNVCRMYDLGTEGMAHFITMEFVEGENLKAFITRAGRLTMGKALSIARQVCEGLAEAHRIGVVHRDLKPQNIMIDREGNSRIMDFGLSRFLEAEGITESGVMLGTPEYISPEQIDMKEVDKRSDIYSLGIILYEMLTGKMPFMGETPLGIAMKHKSEKPKDVREINPQLSAELSRIVMKCLEKDREKRYQSVEELLSDLSRIEQDLPTVERDIPKRELITSREITITFRLRKILLPGLSVIVLIIAAVFFVQNYLTHPRISSQEHISPMEKPRQIITQREKETAEASKSKQEVLGLMGDEILKYMSSNIENLEGILPDKGPYREAWNRVSEKLKEGKKLLEEGNTERVKKSNMETQTEMKKLLALVSERESAQQAKKAMSEAKARAEQKVSLQNNLLFQLASYEEGNAQEAFTRNDFSGAKVLYRILEKIYGLSLQCRQDENCVQILQFYTKSIKGEVEKINPSLIDQWLYGYARGIENQALLFQTGRDFTNAAGAFLQAAFLYEKIIESAATSPKY